MEDESDTGEATIDPRPCAAAHPPLFSWYGQKPTAETNALCVHHVLHATTKTRE